MQTATSAASEPIIPFMDAEEPEAIVEQPSELAVQCVLYVGDILTVRQKQNPAYRLGGKIFSTTDFRTVPKTAIVPRCAITRLRKSFRSVHKNMIDEKLWPFYVQSYTLRNQWNPAKGIYEDIVVGKDGASKDLLFKEIRPIHEIGRIAGLQNGVIALDAEAGINSAADIKEAQFHYFPNWLEISAQKEGHAIPERLRDLQDHLANRREQTQSANLRAIGDAFLLSCSDFYDWGKSYIDYQTAVIKETEKFPGGARYDEVAERMFRMLDLTREDKMVQDFATNQQASAESNANLTQAMAMMATSQVKMDNVFTVMADILADKQGVSVPTVQAPAPVTVEDAVAELERTSEEDTFVDMTEAIAAPTEGEEEIDPIVAEYLGKTQEPVETEE